LKLLLDEMYPPALARALHAVGIDAITIIELGMAGTADPDVFAYAIAHNRPVLTENVADFVTIAAQHSTTGARHPGLLIALSNRFSRRASRRAAIVKAIQAHQAEGLTDRIIYLEVPTR
jgi:predicted nuclease of predicted toxin-antitoxin system